MIPLQQYTYWRIVERICRPFLFHFLLNVSKHKFQIKNKTLERCQWHRSSVIIVNWENISNFDLIVDFEEANVCWVHIEKTNTSEGKIGCVMRYVVGF